MKIKGVFTPILTPYRENGFVHYDELERNIEFLIAKGVHGLFPLGTTGEGMLLSGDERKEVAAQSVKFANGRIPVVIHVGDQTTEGTIELARHAENIGADGISVICPYFFPVDDEAIFDHYSRISLAVSDDFPVFVYNFPGNARNEISLPVLLKLVERHRNIRALKFSSDNFSQILRIIAALPEGFPVMLGPDQYFVAGLHAGSAGGVSGNSNVFPELFVKAYQYYAEGQYEKARDMQRLINRVSAAMKDGLSMSHFKHALAYRGLATNGMVRGPLRNITKEEVAAMYEQLEQIERLAASL